MCPSGRALHPEAPAVRSDYKPAFDVLDADHDGKISREDLRNFYARLSGEAAADEELIGSMMTIADLNKDGFVEYEEFERVLNGQRNGKRECGGVMEDVFKVMDTDGDGKLSFGDLKKFMGVAGFSTSDEDIVSMIRLAGGDEKEGVSFDGLVKILAFDLAL